MNKYAKRIITIACAAVVLLVGALTSPLIRQAQAIDTNDIIKVGGVLLAVNQFGPQIDNFINNLLNQKKSAAMGATKVVPIVSVGQGAYIGSAQVIGLPANVQRVQAVAAVEGVMSRLQGTLMIPISTKMPGKSLSKVDGVGVSAIIDLKL